MDILLYNDTNQCFFYNTNLSHQCFFDNITNQQQIINYYYIFYLFKNIFYLFNALLFSILFISHCIYLPSKNKFVHLYNKHKHLYEYNSFFLELLEEYYLLEHDKDDLYLKTLINKYIYYNFTYDEKNYKIIMNYNFHDNNFQYYLDSKSINIPFEYLDTIARIYSVKYNCRNIYYDNYENIFDENIFDENILDDNDDQYNNDSHNHIDNNINKLFYKNKNKNKTNKTNNKIYKSNNFKHSGLIDNDFYKFIIDYDVYDSNDILISYNNLKEDDIFSIKKNHDFDIIKNIMTFKDFKNRSIL